MLRFQESKQTQRSSQKGTMPSVPISPSFPPLYHSLPTGSHSLWLLVSPSCISFAQISRLFSYIPSLLPEGKITMILYYSRHFAFSLNGIHCPTCFKVQLPHEIRREILKLREDGTHDGNSQTTMDTLRDHHSHSLVHSVQEILSKHTLYSRNY